VASAEDITRHWDFDGDLERVAPPRPVPDVMIVEPDAGWPLVYDAQRAIIQDALGPVAIAVEHVGSTSVPGLPAKPIIDIDLTVPDPTDEAPYVAPLEAAGFEFVWRERSWHEHRLFVRYGDPRVNLHVFGPDSPEVIRHRMLRDWLRTHPEDRAGYAAVKRAAAAETNASGSPGAYNGVKEPFLRGLLDRIFRAEGLLP
jgi:GrpB-like predicted nucleotidyltransferase (UPF0157 family)